MTGCRVATVIVTYNRKELVRQTLAGVLAQTHDVHKVIVVDNASTDGTFEYLQSSGVFSDNRLEYCRLNTNTGGAGGFHEGFRRAHIHSVDWIWVMDDDVFPASTCLEQLLEWRQLSECIHPRRIDTDGKEFPWEHYLDIYTCSRTPLLDSSFRNGKGISYTNVACFEGMLVSGRVAALCGLPDRKYFIGEDDTLFGILANQHTNVAYVSNAIMRRMLRPAVTIPPWRRYYAVRNKFLLLRDACDSLGLIVGPRQLSEFVVLRVFDLLGALRHGVPSFVQATRGFCDGLSYLRRRKEFPNPSV